MKRTCSSIDEESYNLILFGNPENFGVKNEFSRTVTELKMTKSSQKNNFSPTFPFVQKCRKSKVGVVRGGRGSTPSQKNKFFFNFSNRSETSKTQSGRGRGGSGAPPEPKNSNFSNRSEMSKKQSGRGQA